MTLVVLLFALLVVFTSRWSVFEAESLENESANRRPLIEQAQIPRGIITATDGTVLARNQQRGSGSSAIFTRLYPQNELMVHAMGYSFIDRGQAGTEQFRNDALAGLSDEFSTILDELTGGVDAGDDVRLTLDPDVQRAAVAALGGRRGGVVAIEPSTGRVRAMVSVPQYDPNTIPDNFAELASDDESSPLLNRATQATYPPGSTFKVVTATAALDTGEFTPSSTLDGSSPQEISGVDLSNCCTEGSGDFGPLPFSTALQRSVNTAFANVGVQIGRGTLVEYMKRFGFYEDPPLDYPDGQMAPSGIFNRDGELVEDGFDVGRAAIGQGGAEGQTRATPLQMAMVAAAIGNDGVLMEPRLTERIVAPDGRVEERVEPEEHRRVMKEETAAQMQQLMRGVVQSGTAAGTGLDEFQAAGKTGTAEVADHNQAWFITFAPADDPQIAIAATVEETQGQGASVAAPIARRVLQEILG
ncbi:MAG: penicillin-binding protein 2 [Thermoleophilaceae bacterium]